MSDWGERTDLAIPATANSAPGVIAAVLAQLGSLDDCSNAAVKALEQRSTGYIPDIDKRKYMVPADLTFGQFMHFIRSRLRLRSDTALFLFVNNDLVPMHLLMSQIYRHCCQADGFLYCTSAVTLPS